MSHRPLLLPTALAAALALAGCGEPRPPSSELFPLDPGHRWVYRQHTAMDDGGTETMTLGLRTLPREDFEDRVAYRRHSDDGVDYWLRRDETGIYRVATRHELQPEIAKDPTPRYVLKEPLAVGTEWQVMTVPYLLRRTQGFPPEVRHENKPVAMRFVIEALKESVTVPAGRFEGCVRVRGQAVLRLFADGALGWKDMPLTTTEWYCPGPGLVKLVREEPAHTAFLLGGQLTLELSDWQQP